MRLLLFSICMAGLPASCFAHPGRTDASGGHMNRRTGEYHNHGGGTSQDSSESVKTTTAARIAPPKPRTTSARTTARSTVASVRRSAPVRSPEASQDVKDEMEAQLRLKHGESNEAAKKHYAALRDYDKVRRTWPATQAAIRAREHIERIRANEPLRTWKDVTGRFEIVAKFIREENHSVVLQSANAKTLRIEFVKLSAQDKSYVVMRRRPVY